MPKYRVYFTQVIDVTVDVEADSPDEAVDLAYDDAPGPICAQCSGWGQGWSKDDGGELEAESVLDLATEQDVWTAPDRWKRVADPTRGDQP